MADSTSSSSKPDYSSELNIESIISAPLVAASKANVVMVTGQTRFLLDYCFEKKDNSKSYEPVMIEMVMTRGVIDSNKSPTDPNYIVKSEMKFAVPLLCLVPLNSLAIDKVNVEFDMEITSMTSHDSQETGHTKTGQLIDRKATLYGKISAKQDENANPNCRQYKSQSTSRLVVNINAGPLPLPVGVLTILDLYTKAIQPTPKTNS